MISVSFESFVSFFLVTGLLFFMLLWLYYDRRDRVFYDNQRLRHVHHCVKCGTVYTSQDYGQPVGCPNCGFKNPSLRF